MNMARFVWGVLTQPFTWGLIVGLIFAAWALSARWAAHRKAKAQKKAFEEERRESEAKRKELQATIEQGNVILARKIGELQDELAASKAENAKLRLEFQEREAELRRECELLKNKPGRAELKKLDNYEKAVGLLQEHVPGFAQCWPKALRAAEKGGDVGEELKQIGVPVAEAGAPSAPALPPAT